MLCRSIWSNNFIAAPSSPVETQQLMDTDFESDSLELDLLFNSSNPMEQRVKSPVIPRAPLPRRQTKNSTTIRSPEGKGVVKFQPHISSTTGQRSLPLVTAVNVEPSYKLDSFHNYPNQDKDVTTDAVFTHIVSDLNRILDTSTRYFPREHPNQKR